MGCPCIWGCPKKQHFIPRHMISDYFFLLLLLAPLQAFWILWKNVIAPWIFAEAPEPDEADLKRQSKKERRQQKIKYR